MNQTSPAIQSIAKGKLQFALAIAENTQPDTIVDDDAQTDVPVPQAKCPALQGQVQTLFTLLDHRDIALVSAGVRQPP
ncbi:hypothetical protein D3C71_1895050 [compost metagenome]